jgi:hypothetical protein
METSSGRQLLWRETNREIRANLRDDWKWPFGGPTHNRIDDDTQWRERYASASSSHGSSSPNPYKYDDPDSISLQVESRKSDRSQDLLDELCWNEGLRTYIARRNDWTGGSNVSELPKTCGPQPESADMHLAAHTKRTGENVTNKERVSAIPALVEIVPLPRPILPPSHPLRANITPTTYLNIYNKAIKESITPRIPINLSDMTQIISAGWKANGEWPPVPLNTDHIPIARKKEPTSQRRKGSMWTDTPGGSRSQRQSLTTRSVGRMKKVLGLKNEAGSGMDYDPKMSDEASPVLEPD